MIAYDNGTVYATSEDWGLVQNSLALSGQCHDYAEGWSCTFKVGGILYSGFGWSVRSQAAHFVGEHRQATRIDNYSQRRHFP
jgi:hypothetical protein